MSESFDLEINDLPPEETLTLEEKERIAGAGYGDRLFTGKNDMDMLDKLSPQERFKMVTQFGQAAMGQQECFALAQMVATDCGCQLIKGPMKSLESADRKVRDDYSAKFEPWSELKDIVRVTILIPSERSYKDVKEAIERCCNRASWRIIKAETVDHSKNESGYSGMNYAVEKTGAAGTKNPMVGWAASTLRMEIQANYSNIIYAKERKKVFIGMLGGNEAAEREFERLRGAYKIEGGMGHLLYEVSRDMQVAPAIREKAKSLSKDYYGHMRNNSAGHSDPKFQKLCLELTALLDELKQVGNKHVHDAPRSVSVVPMPPPHVSESAKQADKDKRNEEFKRALQGALSEYEESLKKPLRSPSEESIKAHKFLKNEISTLDFPRLKRLVRWYMGKDTTIRLQDGASGPALKPNSTFMQILKKAFPRDDLLRPSSGLET